MSTQIILFEPEIKCMSYFCVQASNLAFNISLNVWGKKRITNYWALNVDAFRPKTKWKINLYLLPQSHGLIACIGSELIYRCRSPAKSMKKSTLRCNPYGLWHSPWIWIWIWIWDSDPDVDSDLELNLDLYLAESGSGIWI